MRILVLGAGGIGGYFGGRLAQAGATVTLLVRDARAAQLRATGLIIESPLGEARIPAVNVVTTVRHHAAEIILLTCKAYDLGTALEAISSAVTQGTVVLPLLNGLAHLDTIQARFPEAVVWGGLAHLGVTVTPDGIVRHLNGLNSLMFGPRNGNVDGRAASLAGLFTGTAVDVQLRERIDQDLWDKFVFITALAGMTCLMRANVGMIVDTPAGKHLMLQLLTETTEIATASGYSPQPQQLERYREQLTQTGSPSKASMLRDVENSGRTECEHILGDMLARAQKLKISAPLLEIAATHMRAYEQCRAAAA
jgi:2-dehydropantoate 2-reductase